MEIIFQSIYMGCEACKVGEGLGNDFFTAESAIEDNQGPKRNNGILKVKEKDIWSQNLTIQGIPGEFFWQQDCHLEHSCFPQIKKDIPRSFPNTTFFSQKSNINRFQLLLKKFASYFPKLGYTQGLNFVAGYILIAGFTDSKAFQILCSLMLHDKMLLLGLYQDQFPLNRLYCAVFWRLLQKRLPKTAQKLRLAGVVDQSWIFQWFMSFFLYSFPVEFVKRFIDYIICKKQLSIVTIAIGIVNCLKQDIAEMQDPDQFDFFQFFDKLKNIEFCEAKIDIDKVINYSNSFTKLEIAEALSETKMKNNLYFVYFRKEKQRSEIWQSIVNKLDHQRKLFRLDPSSSQYKRDQSAVEHLERFLLKQSRLYRSRTDSRFSSQFSSQIRTSNFTVNLEPINQIMSSESEKLSHFYKEAVRETEADGGTNSQESRNIFKQKKY